MSAASTDSAAGTRGDAGTRETSEAESVASAVLAVDGVVAMSAGSFGQFRSYLPGGLSVPGVRLDAHELEINVVAHYGESLPALGEAVAAALVPLLAGRSLTVTVDDVVRPGEHSPDAAEALVEVEQPPGDEDAP